jgi:hypothetical protein
MLVDMLEGDVLVAMETISAVMPVPVSKVTGWSPEMPLSLRLTGLLRVVWVQASSEKGDDVLLMSATIPLSLEHMV